MDPIINESPFIVLIELLYHFCDLRNTPLSFLFWSFIVSFQFSIWTLELFLVSILQTLALLVEYSYEPRFDLFLLLLKLINHLRCDRFQLTIKYLFLLELFSIEIQFPLDNLLLQHLFLFSLVTFDCIIKEKSILNQMRLLLIEIYHLI